MQRFLRRHRAARAWLARFNSAPAQGEASRRKYDEHGLTLVEVIVAIWLLATFAITFAPILYTSLDITAKQATIAYAAQQASSYIDDARDAAGGSCAGLTTPVSTTKDPRDVWVKVSSTIDGCSPTPTVPTAVTLTVTACQATGAGDTTACAMSDRKLTVVSTKIMVQG